MRELIEQHFDEAADYVEVLRRLWDSWEDDAEIRDVATGRFIDRDKLHYIDFEGRWFSVQGPVDHAAAAAGPAARRRPRPRRPCRTGSSPARPTSASSPRVTGRAPPRSSPRSAPSSAAGRRRTDADLHIFGDLVVFLDDTPPPPASRRARLDELAGDRTPATPRSSPAPPPSWPTCCSSWRAAGLSGFRLRPAALPHDLRADHRRPGARAAAPRRCSAPPTRPATLRGLLGLPRPANRYALRLTPDRRDRGHDKPTKQIHLAAHFPGVNNTTVWSDPAAGSHIEFDSFAHFAQTAERGKFDFLFLAEGLRLREQNGQIYDLDVVGPPRHLHRPGRAGRRHRPPRARPAPSTPPSTSRTRSPASSPRLDHLSGGRAAWNVVTSLGRLHRRELPPRRLPRRRTSATSGPSTFLQTAHGAVRLLARRRDRGRQARAASSCPTAEAGAFAHHGRALRHRRPVQRARAARRAARCIFQAGDSDEGREFAAATADAIFTRHATLEAGQAFYADVKGRLPSTGAARDELLILPAATFVLGDTDAEARELAARGAPAAGERRRPRSSFLEQLWNRDLSDYDPDGPLPDIDPVDRRDLIARGRASVRRCPGPGSDRQRVAGAGRDGKLSSRELVIEVTGRQSFIGSPQTVAAPSTSSCRPTPATASSSSRTSPRTASTPSSTGSCRCCRSAASSAPTTTGTTLRDHLGLAPLAMPGRQSA